MNNGEFEASFAYQMALRKAGMWDWYVMEKKALK